MGSTNNLINSTIELIKDFIKEVCLTYILHLILGIMPGRLGPIFAFLNLRI